MRWSWSLLMVGSAVLLATGCATDGRDLADARDWQTTTTRPPPPTSAIDQEPSASGLTLSSPDFEPGAEIPVGATCAGDNVFPNLEWGDVGSDAAELVVTLADQTDPEVPVLLWLMAGIPPETTELDAGVAPAGAIETTDDYGITGYGEPCLESFASGTRDLQFELYVLPESSGLEVGHPGNEAWDQVRREASESATVLARAFNDS